jgi:hypothetical protein
VVFNSGEKRSGILHSTVLYLKEKDPATGITIRNRKFILRSKQKGEPGETFRDLVYITRIRMLDEGDAIQESLPIELLSFDPKSGGPLKALTQETLTGVPVKVDAKTGKPKVFSTLGENVFLAVKVGDRYLAGWPEEGTKRNAMFKQVEKEFLKTTDYYNERKMLGYMPLDKGRRMLVLSRLRRQVPAHAYRNLPGWFEIDKDGNDMEFFRLSIWLYNRDLETGTMVLMDRGSFYRQRLDAEAPTPEMGVCPDLWPVVMKDGRIYVGKQKKEVKP